MRKHPAFCCLVAAILLLASLSNAHADEKLPVPPQAAQDEAMELVKEVFGNDLNSRDSKVLARVASDLLKQADDPNNDAPMRYVLLLKAAEAAAEAGDADIALNAIARLEQQFRANTGQIEQKVLGKMASAARQPEEYAPVAEAYARLAVKALANDDFATANEAARHARTSAQRTRNVQAVQAMNELQRTVTDAERSFRDVANAMRTLSANPNDPAANEVVGRHLAFTRGDWAAGLPHLVKAADKEIAAAAQTELGAPEEPESRLALGDAWYAIAAEESDAAMKNTLLLRAALHYREALPTLEGLARRRIEVRIGEADAVAETGAGIDVPELSVLLAGGRQRAEIRKLEEGLGYKLGRRPDDAVEFQGRWYKLIERPMRWDEAQAHCRELGGFLMIVDSQGRQDFAVKLAGGRNTWIGLRRVPEGGDFFWVDGSAPEFTAWAPRRPNNYGGGQHWARLCWQGSHAGRWNDSGNYQRQFICEWVR